MWSNCLLASVRVRLRRGGKLRFWPVWQTIRAHQKGYWGHFFVEFPDGSQAHFKESSERYKKNLSPCQQFWFEGDIEIYSPKHDDREGGVDGQRTSPAR